ncbi:hypothetical protein F0U44_05885 [Nocardioides humilatus]|uniref:DUF4432 family protein n=1 Tax=Nocardioides humilatus TaxID=2607660 RepID=A0A5B1LQB3_9ACTN|nr:hypothetical protein [Nocardioides humilatus]KAA1421797.1 hypothetical protein F0U44_05885 [Nocardioides humilatus]
MSEFVTLRSAAVEVVVDPAGGADIVSLVHRATGTDVLFRTPWADHAQAVRDGRKAATSYDPVAGPLERYRGGWQLLCPVAGAPRPIHGAPTTFHGEAMAATWTVVEADAATARLAVDLYTVPLRIDRDLALTGDRLTITDTLTNLSDVGLEIDYISHPAFGGAFLDGRVRIDTGARRYTADPATEGSFVAPGSTHSWPAAEDTDLRDLPLPGERRMAFGWLSDFDGHWASITNLDLGVGVRLEWDAALPYAWFWQELHHTEGFPWHRRARAFAIEPASTITGGEDRESCLSIAPSGATTITHSITIESKERP